MRISLALLLLLAGCEAIDPTTREGMWHPNGANDTNLRAMVAVPADLVRGRTPEGGDGQQAAAALDRARHDKVRPLPDSAIAKLQAQPQSQSGSPASN